MGRSGAGNGGRRTSNYPGQEDSSDGDGRACCTVDPDVPSGSRVTYSDNKKKIKQEVKRMKEVYLDNSATTQAYACVGDIVRKVMCEDYGNPSSMHAKGVAAENYVKEAKETLAKIWKVQEKEIFFTSGGTESDNLALIGAARANHRAGKHLITSSIEHPAILNTMRYLEEEEGFRVTYLPVDPLWTD